MVARQLSALRGSGSGLLTKLVMVAGAAAAAAAAAWWHVGRRQGGGGGGGAGAGGDLGAEMRSLSERINIAQQRLRWVLPRRMPLNAGAPFPSGTLFTLCMSCLCPM
jgi:hypothetical protein